MSKLISVLQNWMLRPFAARLGREQHGQAIPEGGDGGVLVGAGHPAFEQREVDALLAQQGRQTGQGVAVMNKDQLLLLRVLLQQVDQRRFLATRRDGGVALRQTGPGRGVARRLAFGIAVHRRRRGSR